MNLKKAWRLFRSGLAFKLLDLVIDITPEPEKTSLVIALHQHLERCLDLDD